MIDRNTAHIFARFEADSSVHCSEGQCTQWWPEQQNFSLNLNSYNSYLNPDLTYPFLFALHIPLRDLLRRQTKFLPRGAQFEDEVTQPGRKWFRWPGCHWFCWRSGKQYCLKHSYYWWYGFIGQNLECSFMCPLRQVKYQKYSHIQPHFAHMRRLMEWGWRFGTIFFHRCAWTKLKTRLM